MPRNTKTRQLQGYTVGQIGCGQPSHGVAELRVGRFEMGLLLFR
jgi:hypothetical protein